MLGQGECQLDNSKRESSHYLASCNNALLPRLIVQTADMLSLCVRMVKDV